MELILRARATGGVVEDVIVDVDLTHSVAELARALADEVGVHDRSPVVSLLRTGRSLDPQSAVGDSGIVSGDEVVVGFSQHVQAVPPIPEQAVSADVLAGPDAGSSTTLLPGSFVAGRNEQADIVLGDPTVSRSHVEIHVADDWSVTVAPLPDVANPVTVNDVEIDAATIVEDHDVVGVGGTRLAFRSFVRAAGERTDQLGQIEFQRTPYRPPVVHERDAPDLGPIPERREGRRFQILTALAPLAAGLTFFAFSRQPQFLIITLMSPLVMIANGFEDRRSGKKKFSTESAEFAERLVKWRAEIDEVLEEERVERLRAAPDLADLARRAELRTVDLWARGRDAPDFLKLRVGLGSTTPLVTPEIGRGGEDELRVAARDALVGADVIRDVPVTNDLVGHGVYGIHGPADLVTGIASSLVVQAGCLHSPEDLTIVAAVHEDRPMTSWLKWLPHVRAVTSPMGGDHMAITEDETHSLVGRLLEVAEYRTAAGHHDQVDRRWPWILAVIDANLRPDPSEIARLLDLCPEAGISVVWLADSAAGVPRQAHEVLVADHGPSASLVGTVWSTDPAVDDRSIEVEQIRLDIADRVARALAPIRDASTASLASSIPRVAPLLDVLGVGTPTAEWVTEKWLSASGYGLSFPIGMGASGPLVLDLVEDGPHTLIGGTSGAGKSELMQSIVASLAVNHSPQRLNFLFVDYKGGASSNVFGGLPHTVGYVTNLSAELSIRALTSLRAELNRRMAVMEGRAKDLAEMLEEYPEDAPPSLVIVVDEFATLVKEVPEFVAGVVDIAQRGRSLGIHLILATQRPSGSVNENILANTNLRMSLRMLDRSESNSVIDSPDAADIPVPLKGRAYARLGPRHLAAFQSAFCGAPLTTEEIETPVLTARFDRTDDSPKSVGGGSASSDRTHLDAVLDAVSAASNRLRLPTPRKPWRDVLPDHLTLGNVLDDPRAVGAREHPGRIIAMGMVDAPEQQDQTPALIDLEAGGGWLIFGSGGSGKTTALRTLAVSAAACAPAGQLEIVGFDFASRGLASILPLPQVVGVASGDDLEAVTRQLARLGDELQRRRTLLATAHAEDLSAYNEGHEPLPRLLVLVDGFGGFTGMFTGSNAGGSISMAVPMEAWTDMLNDLVVDGRQVGVHVVITADRRSAVPTRLHSAVSNRLVLRHADEGGYTDHGVPTARAKGLDLAPGRGLWQADSIVQIAAVSHDHSAKAQGDMISRFGRSLGPSAPSSISSRALPDEVRVADLCDEESEPPLRFPLGVHDLSGTTAIIDMTWSNFLISGAPRSGRSTTLTTCAAGLRANHHVWAVGASSSAIDRADVHEEGFGRAEAILPVLDRLANLLEMGPTDVPQVLLLDDLDTLDDASLNPVWERLAKSDSLRIIASLETRSLAGYTTNPLLTALRRARRMLVLQPDDATEILQATGVKAPLRPGQRMVPGRGILIIDRIPSVVQVAIPERG
ncbi:FtsK/SpoIIIE domain-containing protein [Ilumatobacter nonamiensis]|uniref:FtsK/SpoIIIE domain-containing protein n=1 Tax=Ilumatobacter nonamiensis TaxID=467093 RepID=UPI00034DF407|nr:FtsK/SpoIIIE domain-containing protein [Ilumatobacter nonamiensis]